MRSHGSRWPRRNPFLFSYRSTSIHANDYVRIDLNRFELFRSDQDLPFTANDFVKFSRLFKKNKTIKLFFFCTFFFTSSSSSSPRKMWSSSSDRPLYRLQSTTSVIHHPDLQTLFRRSSSHDSKSHDHKMINFVSNILQDESTISNRSFIFNIHYLWYILISISIIASHISILNDMMIKRSTDHRMISQYLLLQKRFFSSFSNSFNNILLLLNSVLYVNLNCDAL